MIDLNKLRDYGTNPKWIGDSSVRKEVSKAADEIERLKELGFMCAGWMYAQACTFAEDGIDIGQVEVPHLLEKMKRDIPELAGDE